MRKRLKIIFLLPSLKAAGAETQIVELVNGMDPLKYEIHLITYEANNAQLSK